MPQTPNGGTVVGNPGMSPFGQTMTSPASYPALQSNGPAPLASPSHPDTKVRFIDVLKKQFLNYILL